MIKLNALFMTLGLSLLAGCGGGGGGGGSPAFMLGGTLSGLASGRQVVLFSGAGNAATLSDNGGFRFPDGVPRGTPYSVVVRQQPADQTCTVFNGADPAGIKGDVNNLRVLCEDNKVAVGGTISNLPPGSSIVLSYGPSATTVIAANGAYALPVKFAPNSGYTVTVATQPLGANCQILNGSGTVAASAVSNVNVSCSAGVPIGGEVLGLALGETVLLKLTGSGGASQTVSRTVNGAFQFTPLITFGGDYEVSLADPRPATQTCVLSGEKGAGITVPVTQVRVNCSGKRHAVGGNVTGLTGSSSGQVLTLRNGQDLLSVPSNGPFQFPTLVPDRSGYSVTIVNQPTGQTCTVLNSSASAVTAPVVTVAVQCLSFVWRSRALAGSGVSGNLDGSGTAARLSAPAGVALDSSGAAAIADFSSSRIRRLFLPQGFLSTIAGTSVPGFADNATALAASFNGPVGLAVNLAGDVFIADAGNHRIRVLRARSGQVETFAGSGVAGYGDGSALPSGLNPSAQFNNPRGLAIDAQDNLYVADTGNHVIRKISPAGVVSLLAGDPAVPGHVSGPSAQSRFSGPEGVAVSRNGVVFVADTRNHLVRAIRAGQVTDVAGSRQSGLQDGSMELAAFTLPVALAVDGESTLYVADTGNHAVRQIQLVGTSGTVLTIAGTGRAEYREGVGIAAAFNQPAGIALDSAGNLLITEGGGHRVRQLVRSSN